MTSFVTLGTCGVLCGAFLACVIFRDNATMHAFHWSPFCRWSWCAFDPFTSSICVDTLLRSVSCCFLTDSLCLALFIADCKVRLGLNPSGSVSHSA